MAHRQRQAARRLARLVLRPLSAALAAGLLLTACSSADRAAFPTRTTGQPTAAAGASPSGEPAPLSPAPAAPSAAAPSSPPSAGGLSDEQLVGQLFMSYVYGSGPDTATGAQRQANIALYGEPTPAQVLRRWHLGGVILIDHNDLDPDRPTLSTGNVAGRDQVRALTSGLQAVARADSGVPLLVATDQEGGRVQRLRAALPSTPSQQQSARLPASSLRCQYATLGAQLRDVGVNQDFAPVADVVRTATGVIGDRSFGPDPAVDGADVASAVAGLQQAGVLATLKHWPGHGSTATDSHAALAVITESAATWRSVDRAAFAGAPQAAAVMVGHLALPALDPSGLPATLSGELVDGQLRQGLGFTGLVVTDSLWMQPMRAAGTPAQVALRALAAGSDLLLETPDLHGAYAAVLAAVQADPEVRAQVSAAAARVRVAKERAVPAAAPAVC